ncbi:SURF1 family protein [Epibacterium sp. SM1969]|uniref:SURF1-like protein n=1 Tax=Tritonibacter aquimaris TaxID=2663379 RepID=A0A844AYU1_9RHOB|nr:SURF1 family protein [Tritonibacter aquimaris]MQY43111.1 SURF1 family protein [Tritonibacter aquimaris]
MRAFWFLAIVGVLGSGLLLWLGSWQLQRLAWKNAVLAELETSIAADPVALPQTPDETRDKYRAVAATGEILAGEIHVWTAGKTGAGYRVISPFNSKTLGPILVDRGFIPSAAKQDTRPLGPVTLVGNLHWPDEQSGFTPDADLTGNVWYARDVATMAAALNTQPVLIVLRQTPPGHDAIQPIPLTATGIPNDHLQYAITWFSLAAIWAGMTFYFLRRAGFKPKGSN